MHILLDTHIYLWWLADDKKLSKFAREMITASENVYVSSVSLWEAAIKIQLGKLHASINELVQSIEPNGFIELPLLSTHVVTLSKLPSHHRDPFDRMLIAQAISEPLRYLTADKTLTSYSSLVELVS